MSKDHWTVAADYARTDKILAEDDRGEFWVPSTTRPGWWDRRFNPRNPRHWPYWLRARLTNRIARIEPEYD
jgi:hypothetical protein